eukprot:CAMPEP_0198473692 /NCGR_PEP_ID=MMETSP1456-20131121/36133_1 /TAXON_ID=1461544 ORGANISM="Unidentified sp., Strain RCC1871" /NCGR_SAMPLE_ID=MMETSP1456 /ASSEMBLY_ACC=CAM_ASM_001119 /LENGTH=182 /DNA_ID=CAMNT_0044200361 /DNA_START=188 /DNA_END=738 /DNA_ORIENTATION=-
MGSSLQAMEYPNFPQILCAPLMTTGTMGTPACIARCIAPFLKGCSRPSLLLVPSGKTHTDIPYSRSSPEMEFMDLMAFCLLLLSMNTVPLAKPPSPAGGAGARASRWRSSPCSGSESKSRSLALRSGSLGKRQACFPQVTLCAASQNLDADAVHEKHGGCESDDEDLHEAGPPPPPRQQEDA